MMEKELYKTYYFDSADYDKRGRRKSDGKSFRDVIKEFEYDFHDTYSTEYALNLYANSRTMALLAKSNDAAPFLTYGMDLTQGKLFDAVQDPYVNHEMEKYSPNIYVYGIDSAFMTEFDEYGYPVLDEDSDIYPLTCLLTTPCETMKFAWLCQQWMMVMRQKMLRLMYHNSNMPDGNKGARKKVASGSQRQWRMDK